tara:strand:+ start:57 stop:431 length:375 start_codon:yes stop_codon:yes gene_type:complete
MNSGDWQKALLKSILIGYIVVMLWIFISQFIDGYFYRGNEADFIFLTTSVVYFGTSFIGWAVIGIPFHFLLCKWFCPLYRYYLYICTLLSLLIWSFFSINITLLFSIAIFIQVGLFRFYAFKKT